mgnify:CR=1 FL=1
MAKTGGRTRRHTTIRTAMKRLGPGGAEAFLRAALVDSAGILALQLVNDALDRGEPLDTVLLEGDRHGYWLEAHELEPRRFEVKFGCQPGPMAGDGGKWIVEFDRSGAVVGCHGTDMWIS